MTRRTFSKTTYGLVFLSILGIASISNGQAKKAAKQPMKVRWLIAHEPIDAFTRAAKVFAEQLKIESKGEMELVVLTPKDIGATTTSLSPKKVFKLLEKRRVELSQTPTTGIGMLDPKFYVLDLPFLFRDHAHARKVLDGPIGKKLIASLEKTEVRGLAFTYSGGYRVIPSNNKALRSAKDFQGLKVRTTNSPVAQETLRRLGAVPVVMGLTQSQEALEDNVVEAVEATYVRVDSVAGDKTKFINETEHSLFLTSILANAKFLQSLSPAQRKALESAALKAAHIERDDSLRDGERVKSEYQKKGVEIVTMPASERKEMEKQLKPIYKEFEPMLGADLINSIVAAH